MSNKRGRVKRLFVPCDPGHYMFRAISFLVSAQSEGVVHTPALLALSYAFGTIRDHRQMGMPANCR